MLSETIKNLVVQTLEEGAVSHWRTKNDFHTEIRKAAIRASDLEEKLQTAKKNNARSGIIRTAQQNVDRAWSDSDSLVDAANHHHGNGIGDQIRDHAHMTLNPTHIDVQTGNTVDDYNEPHNVNFRKLHGIVDDKNLSTALQNPPPKPAKPVAPQKPKKQKMKKNLVGHLLAGSDLLKWFPKIGLKPDKSKP